MTVEIEIEETENAKILGRELVEKARILELMPTHKNDEVVLEMYTVGRQLIEKAREEEGNSTEVRDTLFVE